MYTEGFELSLVGYVIHYFCSGWIIIFVTNRVGDVGEVISIYDVGDSSTDEEDRQSVEYASSMPSLSLLVDISKG